jgi:hypothetical protein
MGPRYWMVAARSASTLFWAAVFLAAWIPNHKPASDENFVAFLFLWTMSFCAAVGAPFGRTIVGASIGAGLAVLYVVVLIIGIAITGVGP